MVLPWHSRNDQYDGMKDKTGGKWTDENRQKDRSCCKWSDQKRDSSGKYWQKSSISMWRYPQEIKAHLYSCRGGYGEKLAPKQGKTVARLPQPSPIFPAEPRGDMPEIFYRETSRTQKPLVEKKISRKEKENRKYSDHFPYLRNRLWQTGSEPKSTEWQRGFFEQTGKNDPKRMCGKTGIQDDFSVQRFTEWFRNLMLFRVEHPESAGKYTLPEQFRNSESLGEIRSRKLPGARREYPMESAGNWKSLEQFRNSESSGTFRRVRTMGTEKQSTNSVLPYTDTSNWWTRTGPGFFWWDSETVLFTWRWRQWNRTF